MSRAVTDLTARRLRALVARDQAEGRLPCLVAGVVRDGELAWHGCCGAVSPAGEFPSADDVQYRIGSITKTLTAVLVLQLRDAGRLDLGDRLDRHLPGVGYGDRTLRSLLAHSSGMQSEPSGAWWERSPGARFPELAATVDARRAPLPPGATYHYSNLAFGLLGELVARVTGGTWMEQVTQRVLAPLGMSRTSYSPEPPAATGYSVSHFAGTLTQEPAQDTGAMAAAGQLWSTLADLARYAGFLLDGHPDVLARATLDQMRTPQSGSLAGAVSGGYGLGLRLLLGGSGVVFGHTGSMPGFLASLFVDPVRRTGAVCLANGTTGLRCEGLALDLLAELEELEPAIVPPWRPASDVPEEAAEILGVWYWGNTAFGFRFDRDEISVAPLAGSPETERFRPCGTGSFVGTRGYHHGETLEVARNPDGSINHLRCATFVYTRVPYDPAAPIPGGTPAR